MKKLIISLLAVLALGFVSAQTVTLGVNYSGSVAAAVEYGHEVNGGEILFGVNVTPFDWAVSASLGVAAPLFSVPGGDFDAIVRVVVPVFDGQEFFAGQALGQVGLRWQITQGDAFVLPTVEFGAQAPLTSAGFTSVPGWYARGGLGFRF